MREKERKGEPEKKEREKREEKERKKESWWPVRPWSVRRRRGEEEKERKPYPKAERFRADWRRRATRRRRGDAPFHW